MKKFCIFLLSFLMCANLIACGKSDSTKPVETSNGENQEINITTFFPDRYLEVAAKKFEDLNSNIKIVITTYYGDTEMTREEREESYEKYRYTINTELMSGKGPDILNVKGLRYQKYIDQDMFVNINKFMEADEEFNKDEYYTNIFETVSSSDGLYTLPLNYILSLLSDTKNLLAQENNQEGMSISKKRIDDHMWNWEDFFQTVQSIIKDDPQKAKEHILDGNDVDLFGVMFEDAYHDIVDHNNKTADFTGDQFISMLKCCKQLSDDHLIYKSDEQIGDGLFFTNYAAYSIESMANEIVGGYIGEFYRMPSDAQRISFKPGEMYAINNNSKNKDASWKFLKFLLSYEMQSTPELYTFPVNKKAFTEKVQRESKQFMEKHKDINEHDASNILQRCTHIIEEINKDVNYNTFNIDYEIVKIVDEEVQMFFSGQKSAEQIAQILQNKVSTYLKEQL